MNNQIQFVGVPQTDFCYIGILDTKNKVPSASHIDAVYIDLPNGRTLVALRESLIFRNVTPLNTTLSIDKG